MKDENNNIKTWEIQKNCFECRFKKKYITLYEVLCYISIISTIITREYSCNNVIL